VRGEGFLDNPNESGIELAICWQLDVDIRASIRGGSGGRPDTTSKAGEMADKKVQDGV
jgi:hypothetical protein